MLQRGEAWLRHQQKRWMRPDAYRWLRPDAARYLKPGSNPGEIYPGWETKGYRDQPRVPRGSPEGGRWTHEGGGLASAADKPAIGETPVDVTPPAAAGVETPDPPLVPRTASDRSVRQLQEPKPASVATEPAQGPTEEPPEIPQEKPKWSWQRTGFMRAIANWIARNGRLSSPILVGAIANVEWLHERRAEILAATDPPQIYEDLQAGVGKKRPGYDDHHVVERTWAKYFGFDRGRIDDPENLVSIPRLTHYQITGWYGAKNPDFGNLSPREYLADKDWEERRRIGLQALVKFRVLKP